MTLNRLMHSNTCSDQSLINILPHPVHLLAKEATRRWEKMKEDEAGGENER